MANDKHRAEGTIIQAHPNGWFDVQLTFPEKSVTILGYVCGKMRQNFIKPIIGDNVVCELDLSNGIPNRVRISYLLKQKHMDEPKDDLEVEVINVKKPIKDKGKRVGKDY